MFIRKSTPSGPPAMHDLKEILNNFKTVSKFVGFDRMSKAWALNVRLHGFCAGHSLSTVLTSAISAVRLRSAHLWFC